MEKSDRKTEKTGILNFTEFLVTFLKKNQNTETVNPNLDPPHRPNNIILTERQHLDLSPKGGKGGLSDGVGEGEEGGDLGGKLGNGVGVCINNLIL